MLPWKCGAILRLVSGIELRFMVQGKTSSSLMCSWRGAVTAPVSSHTIRHPCKVKTPASALDQGTTQ